MHNFAFRQGIGKLLSQSATQRVPGGKQLGVRREFAIRIAVQVLGDEYLAKPVDNHGVLVTVVRDKPSQVGDPVLGISGDRLAKSDNDLLFGSIGPYLKPKMHPIEAF